MKVSYSGDIAIVGMAGLFAKAPSAASLWANILNKVDAIDNPPPAWGGEYSYDPESTELERIYTQKGGFLKDLSRFDPRPFGIMPNAIKGSEPDHFHALALAAAALGDAGLKPGAFDGASTGVIIGHGIHAHRANVSGIQHGIIVDQTLRLVKQLSPGLDANTEARIKRLLKSKLPPLDVDSAPGLVPNVMTGRICNRLNLMGPNYVLDAACASSLIAVEAAMLELQRGRANVMLAGGVNTTTSVLVYAVFCSLGALSRKSNVRPFDADADGTLLGEGGGILVLKRLEDALDAGDRIYSVLKAIGQSSDGRAKGIMAPNVEGEALAMRRAYQQSGVDPHHVGLLEAHGTGIPLGDQTEIEALRIIWGERRRKYPHIGIGSVKSMIGHCIPGAGAASLIKMSYALHHKILPPTLCGDVNPDLALKGTPFYVNTEARPWIHHGKGRRLAAVNSFGFGGVNAHAVLEEAPGGAVADPLCAFLPSRVQGASSLLTFAAANRDALAGKLRDFHQRIEAAGITLAALAAECWNAQAEGGNERVAIIAANSADLARKIEFVLDKLKDVNKHRIQTRNGIFYGDTALGGKLAFLFPGENSQYQNMLRNLAMHFPAVRRWLDFLDEMFADERPVAPSEAIFPIPTCLSEDERSELLADLMDMELGSESAFAADQALFSLLGSFGIKAQAMLGHSTGENAALVASGIPKLDRVGVAGYIKRMNVIYRDLNTSGEIPGGILLSVGAVGFDAVRDVVDADPDLCLALDNCDNQFILFGSEQATSKAEEALKQRGAICSRLSIARAYHTPQMQSMANAFGQLFESMELGDSEVNIYSCVKAAPFPKAGERLAFQATVMDQYTQPVRFRESIRRLYDDGVRVFVEVGPSGTLTAFVRDILKGEEYLALACDDRNRSDVEQLLHVLGSLYAAGVALDLGDFFRLNAVSAPGLEGAYLPTELPFMDLDDREAAQLREWLAPVVSPGISMSASSPAMQIPAPATVTNGHGNGSGQMPHHALQDHFGLMQDFLAQQQRMMSVWLARRNGESDT